MRFKKKDKETVIMTDNDMEFTISLDDEGKICYVSDVDMTSAYAEYLKDDATKHQSHERLTKFAYGYIEGRMEITSKEKNDKKERKAKRKHKNNSWFNEISIDEREIVIAKVVGLAEEMINEFITNNPNSKVVISGHYESLIERIKTRPARFRIMPIDIHHLVPVYNPITKGLEGSIAKFMKLLSFLYPAGERKGTRIIA